MPQKNFRRMMELIDKEFATRSDPQQLQVTNDQIQKLLAIHPSSLSEVSDEDGPLIWCLMFPTTTEAMEDFLRGRIGETGLLEVTRPGDDFRCIYLCSVTALPEVRGNGLTKQLCLNAIRSVQKDHPVTTLFVWSFSTAGDALAESLAKQTGLVLKKKAR